MQVQKEKVKTKEINEYTENDLIKLCGLKLGYLSKLVKTATSADEIISEMKSLIHTIAANRLKKRTIVVK